MSFCSGCNLPLDTASHTCEVCGNRKHVICGLAAAEGFVEHSGVAAACGCSPPLRVVYCEHVCACGSVVEALGFSSQTFRAPPPSPEKRAAQLVLGVDRLKVLTWMAEPDASSMGCFKSKDSESVSGAIQIGQPKSESAEYLQMKKLYNKITCVWAQAFCRRNNFVQQQQTGKLKPSPEKIFSIEQDVATQLGEMKRAFNSGQLDGSSVYLMDDTSVQINMDNGICHGLCGDKEVTNQAVVSYGEGITLIVRICSGPEACIETPMIVVQIETPAIQSSV